MILELNGVKKSYFQGKEEIPVLDDLNFKLTQGKSVAILGKSGSGKSTFLSLVCGLDKPQQGEIKINGKDIVPLSEEKLTRFRAESVGIIFQRFHLMSTLTALENIMLPMEILKQPDAKARSLELLEKVDLGHRANHFPAQLSGGESQRVAIARALSVKPKILMADEPSGNLDEDTGKKVMNLLFDLVDDIGSTMLLVTHDKELASRCNETFHLYGHKLHASS